MKKLLLVTTAIAGVAMMSAPASAAIDLDVGGFFRGYVVDANSDIANQRETVMRRASELQVNGETTLDNGLTVGAHGELQIADSNNADSVQADEIYAYLSGAWGRVNVGVEDGSAYLLQVGAPSADSNVDGMRVYIEGIERVDHVASSHEGAVAELDGVFANTAAFDLDTADYDQADFLATDRLTYLSPKFAGFQAGVSYAPESGLASSTGVPQTDNDGQGLISLAAGGLDAAAQYEDLIEVAVRYDGEYQGFGFAIGAGYSTADIESTAAVVTGATTLAAVGDAALSDGIDSYNAGLNIMFQNFSLGGNYMIAKTEYATDTVIADAIGGTAGDLVSGDIERTTYVIGGAYDNGPYHVGVSYLNQTTELDNLYHGTPATGTNNINGGELETDKFTVGGGYSFGPGMTFRGSVAWGEFKTTSNAHAQADAGVFEGTASPTTAASGSNDFTQVGVGLDVRF